MCRPPPAAQSLTEEVVSAQLERWPGQARGGGLNSFKLESDMTRFPFGRFCGPSKDPGLDEEGWRPTRRRPHRHLVNKGGMEGRFPRGMVQAS